MHVLICFLYMLYWNIKFFLVTGGHYIVKVSDTNPIILLLKNTNPKILLLKPQNYTILYNIVIVVSEKIINCSFVIMYHFKGYSIVLTMILWIILRIMNGIWNKMQNIYRKQTTLSFTIASYNLQIHYQTKICPFIRNIQSELPSWSKCY